MEKNLNEKLKLFARNNQEFRKSFVWESGLIHPLCALICTEKNVTADTQKVKMSAKIIKKNSGVFSGFRGPAKLALATLLSLEENPADMFDSVSKVYGILRKQFRSSSFLPLTAYLIARDLEESEYEKTALKAKEIYAEMKSNHPFLTSGEDTAAAALFAMGERDNESYIRDMESCYSIMKKDFFSADAVQSLSHVLALSDLEPEEKCNRVLDLLREMKNYGIKFGKGYELPVLGVLAMNINDRALFIRDTDQAENFLKNQKGFGIFGTGKKQRIMYAALLASESRMTEDEKSLNPAAINSVTSAIIAQQAAMIAIIGSTAAASSSSAGR